ARPRPRPWYFFTYEMTKRRFAVTSRSAASLSPTRARRASSRSSCGSSMRGYFSTSKRYWSKESKAREFANIDRGILGPGEKSKAAGRLSVRPAASTEERCYPGCKARLARMQFLVKGSKGYSTNIKESRKRRNPLVYEVAGLSRMLLYRGYLAGSCRVLPDARNLHFNVCCSRGRSSPPTARSVAASGLTGVGGHRQVRVKRLSLRGLRRANLVER